MVGRKKEAMMAHASQIAPDSFFLAMPQESFERAFGTERYIALHGERPPGAPFVATVLPG